MDVDAQIASAERRLQALRQQQATFVARFARLRPAEQDRARKTYEGAILEAEAELKKLRAALKMCLADRASKAVAEAKKRRAMERKAQMAEVVRCPYCASDDDFRPMVHRPAWVICEQCGIVAIPEDPDCKCPCAKCLELNRAA